MSDDFWNRPCAAEGLTSYRLKGHYGWTMIGAKDHADAMREASRSTDSPKIEALEVWNGQRYVAAVVTIDAAQVDKAASALEALLTATKRRQAEQPERRIISPAAVDETQRIINTLRAACNPT
jgi:hypothetical protein